MYVRTGMSGYRGLGDGVVAPIIAGPVAGMSPSSILQMIWGLPCFSTNDADASACMASGRPLMVWGAVAVGLWLLFR